MSSLQTPFFTGKNYEYWSLTMKDLFGGQYVWNIVHKNYVEPVYQESYNNLTQEKKDALKEQRKKYRKYLLYIHQAMHESILSRVATTNIAKQEWDTLETTYEGFNNVNTS